MNAPAPRISGPLLWATVSSLGTQLLGFITFALLARLLGTETFGLVALAALLIDLIQVISAAGISEAVIQRQKLSEEDADTAFWTNLAVGAVFFGVIALCAPFIADLYDRPELGPLIAALASIFLLTPLGAIHTARLTRDLRFRSIAVRNLGAAVAGASIGLPMAFGGFGAWALVSQRIATAAAMVVVVWFAFRWRPRFRFRTQSFKEFLGFGGYLTAAQFLTQFNSRAAEFVSGLVVGPVAIAFIRSGTRIVEVLQQLTFTPFQQISMPLQARAQHDPEARRATYLELSRLSAFLMFPAFLGCAALAEPVVAIVFGPGWEQTAIAIRIVASVVVAAQINTLIIAALTASGHTRANLLWSSLQLPVTLLAVGAAIPFGWVGMLIAGVLRAYVMLPLGLLMVRRHTNIGIRAVLVSILPATISAVAMGAGVHFLVEALGEEMSPFMVLLIAVPSGAALYLALYLLQDRSIFDRLLALLQARRSRKQSAAAAVEVEVSASEPV